MSARVPISLRVTPEQHASWTEAALADDRSLAKWITRLCDAALQPGLREVDRRVLTTIRANRAGRKR